MSKVKVVSIILLFSTGLKLTYSSPYVFSTCKQLSYKGTLLKEVDLAELIFQARCPFLTPGGILILEKTHVSTSWSDSDVTGEMVVK